MQKWYRIGRVCVELDLPDGIRIPDTLAGFEVTPSEADHRYVVRFSDDLPAAEEGFRRTEGDVRMFTRKTLRILVSPVSRQRECRVFHFEGDGQPYAVSCDKDAGYTEVWFRKDVEPMLSYETIFLSPLNLEKYMIAADTMVLHSAYLHHDGGAILFTAPSGTGKSTQAGLWETYRGGMTVNGDRSLLMRDQKWFACGWPVCGSSGICRNEKYPIRAIVYLSQAKENSIRRLSGAEAVKKLYSQITVNMWNTEFQMRTMDLLLQLTAEVPVFLLACNISEEAVACLEGVL